MDLPTLKTIKKQQPKPYNFKPCRVSRTFIQREVDWNGEIISLAIDPSESGLSEITKIAFIQEITIFFEWVFTAKPFSFGTFTLFQWKGDDGGIYNHKDLRVLYQKNYSCPKKEERELICERIYQGFHKKIAVMQDPGFLVKDWIYIYIASDIPPFRTPKPLITFSVDLEYSSV